MWYGNWIIFIFLFFPLLNHAQNLVANKKTKKSISQTVSIHTLSWTENLEADNGSITEKGNATFATTMLTWSRKNLLLKNSDFQMGFFSGKAGGQISSSGIGGLTYNQNKLNVIGLYISLQQVWLLDSKISFSLGASGLLRQISWPTVAGEGTQVGTQTKAISGSPFNGVIEGKFQIPLKNTWVLQQSVGSLLLNGKTLWSLGLGYRY